MAKMMMHDEKINKMADVIEIFVASASDLELLFNGSYDGGDFCTGFVFGRSGSKMLLEIG